MHASGTISQSGGVTKGVFRATWAPGPGALGRRGMFAYQYRSAHRATGEQVVTESDVVMAPCVSVVAAST